MHKKKAKAKRKKKTLASKAGVSGATLSKKIQRVREEDPSLTTRQAAGKAAGILSGGRIPR